MPKIKIKSFKYEVLLGNRKGQTVEYKIVNPGKSYEHLMYRVGKQKKFRTSMLDILGTRDETHGFIYESGGTYRDIKFNISQILKILKYLGSNKYIFWKTINENNKNGKR